MVFGWGLKGPKESAVVVAHPRAAEPEPANVWDKLILDAVAGMRIANPEGYVTATQMFSVFVFTHGQWSDLRLNSLQREAMRLKREAIWRLHHGATLPPNYLNSLLIDDVSESLEIAVSQPVSGGVELSSLDRRLSDIELSIGKLKDDVNTLFSNKPDAKGEKAEQEEGRGKVADTDIGEIPEMKAAVVDSSSIASAVQSYAIAKSPVWRGISDKYPGVALFAIDADPRSFQVSAEGAFDGRASILVAVPRKLRSGRESKLSLTIPARVFGKLSPTGDIEVSGFKI